METRNEPEESGTNGQRGENVIMLENLSSLVTYTSECDTVVFARVTFGSKCYHALGCLLKTIHICVYVTVITPMSLRQIVTFGTESLTLTKW
jgi:hypothetical protein